MAEGEEEGGEEGEGGEVGEDEVVDVSVCFLLGFG